MSFRAGYNTFRLFNNRTELSRNQLPPLPRQQASASVRRHADISLRPAASAVYNTDAAPTNNRWPALLPTMLLMS